MTVRAAIVDDGARVRVTWPDGAVRDVSGRWLFDHADIDGLAATLARLDAATQRENVHAD
jgi:hypothetical protein